MPRVSQGHLVARRQQILDAAQACFVRNGFHATTMQDVIAAANLSVGAVYRYFKSKNDLVEAIATSHMDHLIGLATPLIEADRPLEETMQAVLEFTSTVVGPDGPIRLAIQVWSESLRDERIAAMVQSVYGRFRNQFVTVADRAVKAGQLPKDADVEAVGAALFSLVLGYVLQRVLTGSPDTSTYAAGLRVLLAGTNR